MSRESFPYADDHDVMVSFVRDDVSGPLDSGYMNRTDRVLKFNPSRSPAMPNTHMTVAWYDTAGALIVTFNPGIYYDYAIKTIECLGVIMGHANTCITREDHGFEDPRPLTRVFKYVLNGAHVEPGVPIVLAGPLTMMEFRAARGKGIPT